MIISRQNALVKEVRKLISDKKYRDQSGTFVIEGIKLFNEAVNSGYEIKTVCYTAKVKDCIPKEYESVSQELSQEVFDYTSSEVTPQGILAVVGKKSEGKPNGKSAVLLDGVADPANVGAVIRTAAASGFYDVYLIDTADAFSVKSARASMGGLFKVNIHTIKREDVDKIGLPLAVADMDGENVFNVGELPEICLVIGNEGKGVSKEIRERAKITLSIPMENGMESLNASVSAGIMMYAVKNIIKGE